MKENEKKTDSGSPGGFHRVVPIILLAVAVFIGICYITSGETGMLGSAISGVFLGLFSAGAYAIPFVLAIHALFYNSDIKEKRILSRIIFSILTVIAIGSVCYLVANWNSEAPIFDAGKFYTDGQQLIGGGFVGSVISFALMSLFGKVGVIIVCAVIFIVYLVFFFSRTGTLIGLGRAIIYGILTVFAYIEKGFKWFIGLFKKNKKSLTKEAGRLEEFADDEFFDVDNGLSSLEISELGIKESRSEAAIESNPTLSESVHHRSMQDGESTATPQIDATVRPRREFTDITIDDDIVEYDEVINSEAVRESKKTETESADEVFSGNFDPFNIAIAEAMANKRSSQREEDDAYSSPVVTETVEDITEEEYARIKRAEAEAKAREEAEAERTAALLREEQIKEARLRAIMEMPLDEDQRSGKNVAFNIRHDEVVLETEPEEEEPISMAKEKLENVGYHEVTFDYSEVETDEGAVSYTRVDTKEAEPKFERFEVPIEEYEADGEEETEESVESIRIERSAIVEEPRSFIFETNEDDVEGEEEIPPEEQNPELVEWQRRFGMINTDEADEEESVVETEPLRESVERQDAFEMLREEEEDDDYPPFEPIVREETTPVSAPKTEKPAVKRTGANPFKNYQLPPMDLLASPEISSDDNEEAKNEINENISILVETLASFGVTATIRSVDRGPRITRYEVVPAKGVRVNQITNLFNDICLALASEGVRMEAPIPGKSAIGFEVPNKNSVIVRLRELLETPDYMNSHSSTFVCIGKDVAGEPIFGDIEKYPHALVAGATNMGKSVCINSIIVSMLYHAKPNELRFILIDPKKVEFKVYSGIPHLLVPVVTEAKQAAGALMWAVDEMERRYDLMEQHNAKNIKEYNEMVRRDPSIGEPASRIVIVIDELNDLMMQVRNPVESLIMRLAQKARAAGIHLIIGTQRPDVRVITGTIKANIPTRISCKVTSQVDSRTILEQVGAEKLLPYGDILYKPPERTKPVRVQGAFVSGGEVESIVDFIKSQVDGECYDESVLFEINKAAQKCGNKKGEVDLEDDDDDGEECGYYSDQQFLDAVEVAIRLGKVSTSLLQRKIKIGFSKAARYVDAMEEIGIVSEPNGQKPRDVLITIDEWYEKLSRVGNDN